MEPLRLSPSDARRVAVRAQLLTAERPTDVLDVVRHLTFVQLDPTKAVAPSADLVLWSRLGSSYDPTELRDAVDEQVLIDHHSLVRPSGDLALHRAEMARWPGPEPWKDWQHGLVDWVAANDACGATSSSSCAATGRCRPARSTTPARCRGRRAGGTTTRT